MAPVKTIAMLHTVPGLAPQMEELARLNAPGMRVLHYVDESLLSNTIDNGALPDHVRRRLVDYARYAEESGADALYVTCSSIGEAAAAARSFVSIPVLRIDEPMADIAVDTGERIGILATLDVTLGPTTRLIEQSAQRRGKDPKVTTRIAEHAFDALRRGDREKHDQLVMEAFTELAAHSDVVVLAQASMSRVIQSAGLDQDQSVPVLSSPVSGATQMAALLSD